MYVFSFIYNTATGAANIGGLNFSCLFKRAEIQIKVNKYECPQRLSFSPGNLFWGSFTNHNNGNYLRHGINITTNQRLSPTFRGNGNTIIVGDSQTSPLPIFPEGGGTSVHRLNKERFKYPLPWENKIILKPHPKAKKKNRQSYPHSTPCCALLFCHLFQLNCMVDWDCWDDLEWKTTDGINFILMNKGILLQYQSKMVFLYSLSSLLCDVLFK